jgi:peptidoglycan/xylan/chitin deacetylase (PgdA/CDA1 family)
VDGAAARRRLLRGDRGGTVARGSLILTYHAIEAGPAPLCIEPELFARHLDEIVSSGAEVVTVSELRELERAVALTFDDGYASVAAVVAPLLAARGLVATAFCVAGRLGGRSDWRSRAARARVLPLASASELRRLADAGWEIGSHGFDHEPGIDRVVESRRLLEEAVGRPVRSFAYPYGVVLEGAPAGLAEGGYEAACTTRPSRVRPGADPYLLPRVDAHYLRRPSLLRAVLAGRLDGYLAARGIAARARRLLVRDYAA